MPLILPVLLALVPPGPTSPVAVSLRRPAPSLPEWGAHTTRAAPSGPAHYAPARRHFLLGAVAVSLRRAPVTAAEPAAPGAVLDLQGYLPPSELERLERILAKLESDTGWRVRVLTQGREAPELGPLLQAWRLGDGGGRLRDPNAVLVVADRGLRGKLEAGGTFLRFEVGDNVRLRMPDAWWGRLRREYGMQKFVGSRGEAASVVTSCELIISCLRSEEFCIDVPEASASFF